MFVNTPRLGAALACLLTIVGCRDGASPLRDAQADAPALATGATTETAFDMPTQSRYALSVTTVGDFRPGGKITAQIAATTLLGTQRTKLMVIVPDASRPQRSGVVDGAQPSQPYYAAEIPALTKMQSVTREVSLRFGKPGYYQVVISLEQASSEPSVEGGMWVRNKEQREVWILITPEGGRAGSTFDQQSLPDSLAPEPGPFRRLQGLAARRSEFAPSHSRQQPTTGLLVSTNTRPIKVVYFDRDVFADRPIVGATVEWQLVDMFNNVTASYSGSTDANGVFQGPCVEFPGLEYGRVTLYYANADVWVSSQNASWIEDSCDPSEKTVYVSSEYGWMYSRFAQFIPFSRGLLNVSRNLIEVRYNPSAAPDAVAYYTKGTPYAPGDYIMMVPGAVYGEYGAYSRRSPRLRSKRYVRLVEEAPLPELGPP